MGPRRGNELNGVIPRRLGRVGLDASRYGALVPEGQLTEGTHLREYGPASRKILGVRRDKVGVR